jgi:hypothetical protein
LIFLGIFVEKLKGRALILKLKVERKKIGIVLNIRSFTFWLSLEVCPIKRERERMKHISKELNDIWLMEETKVRQRAQREISNMGIGITSISRR